MIWLTAKAGSEYIANELPGGRDALHDHILTELTTSSPRPTLNHGLLARLSVPQVWTTNYDPLIEQAMAAADVDTEVAVDEGTVRVIASNQRTVIKMHGSISASPPPHWDSPPVITRTDYERYEIEHPRMWTVLRATYLSRTMLFLGFSIRVCEIADHAEITDILTQLLRRTRPARLFVSGSTGAPSTSSDEDMANE